MFSSVTIAPHAVNGRECVAIVFPTDLQQEGLSRLAIAIAEYLEFCDDHDFLRTTSISITTNGGCCTTTKTIDCKSWLWSNDIEQVAKVISRCYARGTEDGPVSGMLITVSGEPLVSRSERIRVLRAMIPEELLDDVLIDGLKWNDPQEPFRGVIDNIDQAAIEPAGVL